MQCPNCGSLGYCYGTKDFGVIKQRYRKCRMCGMRFKTSEEREKNPIRPYKRPEVAGDLFDVNPKGNDNND